jgi:hypothetical protein
MRALVLLAMLSACASRGTTADPVVSADGMESPRPQIILRKTSWIDDSLAARGLGRLEVAVRVADRPTHNVSTARVRIRQASRDVRPAILLDARGVASLDSLPVGQYELIVLAMGHAPTRAVVPVFPGCRTDVEVYVGIMSVGLSPQPPPEKSVFRITTCRDEQSQGLTISGHGLFLP